MGTLVDNIKDSILNFKLRLCCFVAPVRVGILLFGYYNLITSVIALIAVATGSFPPLYMHAQQSFMEGEYVKSSGAFTCCAELSASSLLLSGLYRKDITLLRYFTYVGLCMAAGTLLVYAMVMGILDMLTTILVIISLAYQLYVILLVRSFIVEIKREKVRNDYKARLSYNSIRPISFRSPENYCVVVEPTPRVLPEILPEVEYVSEPENVVIEEVVSDVEEEKKPLKYPFKFVAIKIPKEHVTGCTDDEAKINESAGMEAKVDGTNKEVNFNAGTSKEVKANEGTSEEDPKEVNADKEKPKDAVIKPPKRSFFGRKKKTKQEDREVSTNESKKP